MATKRDYGTFRVRKRGNSWQAEISLGYHPITGKRVTKSITRATKKEAVEAANEYVKRYETGIDIAAGDDSVSVFIDQWLETYISKRDLRESTIKRYTEQLDQVKNVIGHVAVSAVTPQHLDELGKALKNLKSYHKSYKLLKSVFNDAARYDVIQASPFWKHDPPKQPKRTEVAFLSKPELKLLEAELQGEWIEDMILFMLETGTRIGETLALTWDDLNSEAPNHISIRNSVRTNLGDPIISPPKTQKGRRMIELTPDMMQRLEAKKEKNAARAVFADNWQELNLIFPSRAGNYHYQSNVLQEFKRVAKAAGITQRVNLHQLRHTNAAISIAQGMDIYVLSRRLGHENISITLDFYGHLQSGSQTTAATAYQEFMRE